MNSFMLWFPMNRVHHPRLLSDLHLLRPLSPIRLLSYKRTGSKTPLWFQSLAHSFAPAKKLTPSPSILCALFCNLRGRGGGGTLQPFLLLLPSLPPYFLAFFTSLPPICLPAHPM